VLIRNIINVAGFQAGWFAAVLGAAHGMPWLGIIAVPLVIAVHLFLAPDMKAETLLIISAGVFGFCVDTVLVSVDVFTPVPYLLPHPLSPPWMVLLWMNFATALNVSLRSLHGRYLLSSILGAVGGPFAYYSGAKLGATITIPVGFDLFLLAVAWAGAVPVLFWTAARIKRVVVK
jgi:hypothetical protein